MISGRLVASATLGVVASSTVGTAALLPGRADPGKPREQRPVAGEGPAESDVTSYDPVLDVFSDGPPPNDR
ncbi:MULTISPECIES: hypothetical protein [Streptomyces]|uniref:hypothetical protein n=1 Tax=Streptomyces TaxID=1883 RepID=UPI0033C8A9F6